jgi:hypothetical protein
MSLTDVVAQESKTDTDNWVKIDKLELGNVQVSGHVYDNHGAPMSKAKILIHTTDEIYTLKSDETGQFFLAEAKCFTDKKVTVVVEAKKMISKTILLEDFNSHSFKLIVCMVPKEPRRQPKEKYHVLGIYG